MMTDERIAEIEQAHGGCNYVGVVQELIAALREARKDALAYDQCALDLLAVIREHWKNSDLPPDALSLYLASFAAGFARAWGENPPQNGFVHAVDFPVAGRLQIEVRRIEGKSAAQSLAEAQQDMRRLDWLIKTSNDGLGWLGDDAWDETAAIDGDKYDSDPQRIMRAAIDAAMVAEQEASRA